MAGFEAWLQGLYGELSYGHIIVLMAMEASLFPVPAELVVLPAGYLARNGQLDPVLAALAGTLGSLIGSFANYFLGRYVGRIVILKYGRYVLIKPHHYEAAERMFLRNAYLATFVGRLMPVIRHVISLPAGVFGMNKLGFALVTTAGAGLLCAFWVAMGYYFGESALEVLGSHMREFLIIVIALPFLYLLLLFALRWSRRASP